MTLDRLLERRVLFFGGKGGVGKTTVAAAVALHAAERGDRTLLVSTDPAHSTGDMLEAEIGPTAREVAPRLTALEIDPVDEADRYIAAVKERIAETTPPRLAAEVERQIDIARFTPGAEEAALFDRFAAIIEQESGEYDRVVFDTAPLGHTLRLLTMPEQMHTWMGALIGRRKKVKALEARRARFERTRSVLTDARQTAFAFVVIAERLPILETEKAAATLAKYGIPVGAVVINRVLPESADGAFLARRRERERSYLERIERVLGTYPLLRLPLQDGDVVGQDALRSLLRALH